MAEATFAFDPEMARQAAQRWEARADARAGTSRAMDTGQIELVESKARMASRANRLVDHVRATAPPQDTRALPDGLRALINRPPLEEDEIDSVLLERILGATRDFLSVEFLEQAIEANHCVGRIVTRLAKNRVAYGTGFLVSPSLLLTNHHVLRTADAAASSQVEFDYQRNRLGEDLPVQRFALAPGRFFLASQELDFALVAVQETGSTGRALKTFGFCPLIAEEGKIVKGENINIIQHPRGEMKQIVIRENTLIDLPSAADFVAHYGADTAPGSSGSPVFNDQWEVVALHHSGVPRTDPAGNFLNVEGQIWRKGDDPTRLDWIANEGIRISRLVQFIKEAPLRAEERPLRDELLSGQPATPVSRPVVPRIPPVPGIVVPPINGSDPDRVDPNPTDPRQVNGASVMSKPLTEASSASVTSSVTAQTGGGAIALTIPLQITVSLGAINGAQTSIQTSVHTGGQDAAQTQGLLEAIEPDKDYDNRPGYDPEFIGVSVPLPELDPTVRSQAFELAGADGTSSPELKYHHYSVIYNQKRRLAFCAAVNIDASAPFKQKREGADRWFFDPRVPREVQAGNEFYSKNPLDRGHLVMRQDAAWGADAAEAKIANDDTFHFTNCSPQHEIFNQSQLAKSEGLLLWGGLENLVTEQAKATNKKLCVFNGPIFRRDDRKHRGLQLPREFWKIVVFKNDAGDRRAVAFLLSQTSLIKDLPPEEFEIGPYEPFQVKIRDIESRAKLDFGDLSSCDPLEEEGKESLFESGTSAVPLSRASDIVL